MKRPAQPIPHPVNAETPDHEGRGLSHRSANRMTSPIVSWLGPILVVVGLLFVFVTTGMNEAVPALSVLGFALAAVGLWVDRIIENRRSRP